MLKRTYASIGYLARVAATPLMKLYFSPRHVRVRALVLSDRNEVLLVRSWFSHQKWSLPGGGLARGEDTASAAARELFEETGLQVKQTELRELGSFLSPHPGESFTMACFTATIPHGPLHIAGRYRLEMLDAAWFPLAHLPDQRSETVDKALALL